MTILAIFLPLRHDYFLMFAPLYIGPDVFLPLTSALVAAAGFLLMFWHRLLGFVARLFGRTDKPIDQTAHSQSGQTRD